MGDKPAKYWDHEQCAWVRCPDAVDNSAPADDLVVAADDPAVPAQPTPAQQPVGSG